MRKREMKAVARRNEKRKRERSRLALSEEGEPSLLIIKHLNLLARKSKRSTVRSITAMVSPAA